MIRNPQFWRRHARHLLGCAGATLILASCGGGGDAGPQAAPSSTDTVRGALGAGRSSADAVAAPQRAKQAVPSVFNASGSARPGDVVSLQGENFGSAPVVTLEGGDGTPLEIVNRVGTGWLAVQIPANASGALTLQVSNDVGGGMPVKLNAARPLHLDTLQVVAGGTFRIFGRNLLLAGSTPQVSVNGTVVALDLAKSDEHMLTAVAPLSLRSSTAAIVLVDNGNGSGSAKLDRPVQSLAASAAADPFGLGVGWGAGFAAIATRRVDATSDSRLTSKAVCDGSRDDTGAIQQAIDLAAGGGGAVVALPAGRCRLAGGLNLRSGVVLEGAGRSSTELRYESNYPVAGTATDLAGLRNLTLANAGGASEGPLLKDSTRVFLQGVGVKLATSRQMYLTGNRNFVVAGCDFEQTGSISYQGPYLLDDAAGLVFENNATRWMGGAPSFSRVHDSLIRNSRFTRDARFQNDAGTVHALVLDFAHRVAVVGNTLDVANGPIVNTTRNDGETLLSEGGGASRTENLGQVSSATTLTLTDPANVLRTDPFGTGSIPENYGVAIVGGKGAGQSRRVVAYVGTTLTVDRAWDVVPDATSRYATFVWGLEKSLLKNNTLVQNPRGIWLYHAAMRDVDVVGNTISEGGGIYLRSYQNLATKSFMPIWNVLIAKNRVSNSNGIWMSYVTSVFVNADAKAFGIATLGIEMRNNDLVANRPNATSQREEYANVEGFMNMMRIESGSPYESSAMPRLLGTIMANNSCTYCDVAVRLGTGAGGTTVLNTRLVSSPTLWQDWATAGTQEKSTDTVMR